MKRSLENLIRISYAIAWLAVGVVLCCVVLDRSGWIADSVRGRFGRSLGGLEVEVQRARVLWFRPGIVLEDVTVGAGDGFLAFDSVEVRLTAATDLGSLVQEVEIHGGRARVSDALVRGLARASESVEPDESGGAAGRRRLPTVTLTDFQVDLELPGRGTLPVGRVDLKVEGSGDGASVAGRLLPSLSDDPDAAVRIDGRIDGSGAVELEASAYRLPVDSARLPPSMLSTLQVLERARGVLTLAVGGSLHLAGDAPPRFEGRLALDSGTVATRLASDPLEDAVAEIALAWSPDAGDGLWRAEAWDGTSRVRASWNGTDVEVRARVGRSAGGGALRAWATIPELLLSKERLLGADPPAEVASIAELFDALRPSGSARVVAGIVLPTLVPGEDGLLPVDGVLDVRPREDSVVRYAGFLGDEGERWGVPIPARDIGGRVVFAWRSGDERPDRLGLVALRGSTSNGEARFDGVMVGPAPGSPPGTGSDYDMELFVPRLAIDAELEEGLQGMPATRAIWAEYGPRGGGSLSSRWRFHGSPSIGGLTAQGDVSFQAEEMAWSELPIPVRDVEGRLAMRWSDRPVRVEEAAAEEGPWRAFGLSIDAGGRFATGARMRAEIEYRQESPPESVVPYERLPTSGMHVHRIQVDGMSLRGSDFERLAATHAAVGEVAASLGLKGRADVVYRGVAAGPNTPYRFDVDVTPLEVELLPETFQLPIRDVRGRAIVTGTSAGPLRPDVPADFDVSLRGALTARCSPGFVLAGVPVLEGGVLSLALLAAGVDPENRAMIGALDASLGFGGGLDPSRVSLRGAVDAAVDVVVRPGSSAAATFDAEFNLRRNAFVAGGLRLEEMGGTLLLDDEVLRGDRVSAELAGTPVELLDLILAGRGAVDRLDSPDPLLAEPGFLPAGEGLVVQARLSADDVPLDEAHLAPFLDADTVATLFGKAGLRGRIDLEDTNLVIAPDGKGNLKLGLHGRIVPHNTFVRAGLPIHVSSGTVELEKLVIEPGGTRAWAHVDDLYARLAGRELQEASMLVSLVESRLSVENLIGLLERGAVASLGGAEGGSALAVDLVEPHFFTAAIQGQDIDANGLLAGLFETSISDKGLVHGWLRVSGTPGDLLGLRGQGAVKVTEARLWSIPVLRALFGRLGFDRTGQFDEMQTQLRLADGVLYMDKMDARSPILHLVGEGTVDFDGRLHHDLEVQYSLLNRLGPFKILIYWIQNSILRVAIRGTMWRPEIILRNLVRDFFWGDPEHEPSLPLPAFQPLPERF